MEPPASKTYLRTTMRSQCGEYYKKIRSVKKSFYFVIMQTVSAIYRP